MADMVATREFKPSLRSLTDAMANDFPRSKFDVWFGRFAPVIPLACIAWLVHESVSTGNPVAVLDGTVAGLVAAAIVCFTLFWVIPRLAAKSRYIAPTLTRRRYRFDAEALILETADGTVTSPYGTFKRISLHPDCIAFYDAFPGYPTHVIHSDAFESKDQERAVRGWIGAYAT